MQRNKKTKFTLQISIHTHRHLKVVWMIANTKEEEEDKKNYAKTNALDWLYAAEIKIHEKNPSY